MVAEMSEVSATIGLLKHKLEALEVDLQRPPDRPTATHRVQGCIALVEMIERQMGEEK
tara:strand:- start:545 stop:718 length:174 start_codon:yes stop_codon:yes gene_type:complete